MYDQPARPVARAEPRRGIGSTAIRTFAATVSRSLRKSGVHVMRTGRKEPYGIYVDGHAFAPVCLHATVKVAALDRETLDEWVHDVLRALHDRGFVYKVRDAVEVEKDQWFSVDIHVESGNPKHPSCIGPRERDLPRPAAADAIPVDPYELANWMRNHPDGTGAAFTAAHHGLRRRMSDDDAHRLALTASDIIDADAASDRARADLVAGMEAASAGLASAIKALHQLRDEKDQAWHTDYAEGDTGRYLGSLLDDAAKLAAAARALHDTV